MNRKQRRSAERSGASVSVARPTRDPHFDEDEQEEDRNAQRETEYRRAVDAIRDDRPLDGDA